MIFTTLRGSFFLTLMLIVSITLSGCSFDIGSIISGLGNVIGKISGNIGGFIQKGLDFAGGFMEKAQEFIAPIMEVGQAVSDKFAPIAEKVTGAFDKVGGVIDKVGSAGQAISDFGRDIAKSGVDALGNQIQANAPSSEIIFNPNSEDNTIITRPGSQIAQTARSRAQQAAADELITAEERQKAKEQVIVHVNEMNAAIGNLTAQLRSAELTTEQRADLQGKIDNIRSGMSEIIKDPTSSAAKATLKKVKNDVEVVKKVAKVYADRAKATVAAVKSVGSSLGDAAKSSRDFFRSLF